MINRIQKIAGIGIFKDFIWNPASLEDFKKYNALYGWNGSGKTTLSRLFSVLETGDDTEVDLAPDSSCVFATSTGSAVISTSETPTPNNNIKVFNEDFIRNNLEWVTSKATPILIIGKEKIDQKESLAEARRLKERCSTALGHINSNLGSLGKERDKILDKCRKSVVEELSTVTDIKPRGGRATSYRTYTAIDVTNLLTAEGTSFPALTDEEKINRRIALSEKDSKDKLDDYVANLDGVDRVVELVNDLASKTLSDMVESTLNNEIQENDELREWLRVGHKLHPAEVGIVTCKFCKNEISQSRLENIDAFFDQAQLSLIENVDQVLQIISGISIPLPANHEKVYKQFQAGYVKAREAFFVEKLNFDTKLKEAVLKLENKKKRPFEKLQIDTADLIAIKTALEATFSALNAQISQHNETTDQFGKNRANAANDLELHLIGQHSNDFNEKVSAIATVQKRKAANEEELKRQTELEKSLQHSMNDHSIAADEFNKMLKEFLGRSEIALKAESDGYIIERNGKPGKNLSEGERNAIAVIFS